MVRRKADRISEQKCLFGGPGDVRNTRILNDAEEMYNKGRLFNHIYLDPGCKVGYHVHQGDGETYYILKGEGEYNDNGDVTTVRAGDVTFVDAGEGHSLLNTGTETLEAIALILYK